MSNDGTESSEELYINSLPYVVGETVRADNFDPDFKIECAGAIHFFVTRREAEEYN